MVGLIMQFGCAIGRFAAPGGSALSVPEVALKDGECIEGFEITVKGSGVSDIRHIPHDWDIKLEWQDGWSLIVSGTARHFSTGLCSTRPLQALIAFPSDSDPDIQIILTTDRTDPPGGGGRSIRLRGMAMRFLPGQKKLVNSHLSH
jgi:hypothetical protein